MLGRKLGLGVRAEARVLGVRAELARVRVRAAARVRAEARVRVRAEARVRGGEA